MKALIAPFIAFPLFIASTAFAANFDVGGVKLGTKAEDLRSLIAKVNPSFVQGDLKTGGKVVGVQARQDVGSSWTAFTPDHLVALYDEQGYTWFIGRAQKYAKGDRPGIENTLAALREKYGEPSSSNFTQMEWQFTRSGSLYNGVQTQGPCWAGWSAGASTITSTITSPPIQIPKKFSEKCGTHIVATIGREPDGMAGSLVVLMYDATRVYDAEERRMNSVNADEAKRLEAEKSKGLKPKL